jgi:predicted short-subunit dehydrogenase-like oxidoreductase (DUF2520 family)
LNNGCVYLTGQWLRGDMQVGFIGAGPVGSALAGGLARAGVRVVAVSSRNPDRALALANAIDGCVALENSQDVVDRTDLVFLTVPDDSIASVCDQLEWRPGTSAVHCSGALSSEVLESAARSGALVASCHPMQTFSSFNPFDDRLSGCLFGIEGDGNLRTMLTELIQQLGGQSVVLDRADKPIYHVAAVLTSNYLVTLSAIASELLGEMGLDRNDALHGLLPLMRGSIENLELNGIPDALTGPIARGDLQTVESHLAALRERHPEILPIYTALAHRTILIARERGTLPTDAEHAIRKSLETYHQKDGSNE